jgi:hypothetical protein
MSKYNNKLRSYYFINNILNIILFYKDIQKKNKNNFNLKKLIINFKLIQEKKIDFFFKLIDIYLFFKLFNNKICIKNFIIGNLNLIFKKIEKIGLYCIIQTILKKKNIFIFLNYILYFFKLILKYNLKKNLFHLNINYLKKINYLFLDLNGFFEIFINSKKKKNYILFFIINSFIFFYDK